MAVARGNTVVHRDFASPASRFGLRAKIKADILPCVAALRVPAKARSWLVSAMDHAVFATAVFDDTIYHAVLLPLHFLQQLRVARIARACHEIAGAFPAADVTRWNCPG